MKAADIYRLYFHGPAYQVVEQSWWDGKRLVARFARSLPANQHPPEPATLLAPRLIELCFQTAGLWEMGIQGRMGLPLHIDELRWFRNPSAADTDLYAVIVPNPQQGNFDGKVVDAAGNCYLRMNGYRTVTLTGGVADKPLKALQQAMVPEAVAA